MSSEEKKASDVCSVKQVPEHLLGYVRSQILKYLGEVEEFSAEISQSPGQPARLIFYTGIEAAMAKAEKQAGDTEPIDQEQKETRNTILVKKLPHNVNEEILELFFENEKRKGGGPVESVYLNRKENCALIEFSQPDAVDVVMSKLPISLMDTELEIQPFTALLQGDMRIENLDIHVRGLPKELTHDLLTKQIQDAINLSEMSSCVYMSDDEENAAISTITDIKPLQLRMLTLVNYPDNISEQFPDVKIKIEQEANEINFHGSVAAVQSAKLNLYKTLASFSLYTLYDIPEDSIKLLQRERVTQYVNEKLAAKEFVCAWEVNGLALAVCSIEAHIAECTAVIKGSVEESTFPISKDSAGNFLTVEWQDTLKQLQEQNDVLCRVFSENDKTEVHVTATDDAVGQMVSNVETFLKKKATITSQRFSLKQFSDTFVKIFEVNTTLAETITARIAKDLSVHYVTVETIYPYIGKSVYFLRITGTPSGLELARERINSLNL